MSWERGRPEIERLLADGELERVTPSDEVAGRLIADAEAHIGLAGKGVSEDPAGALQLSYDAARKRPQRCSPSRGCGARAAAATSRSSTQSGRSSTTVGAWRSSAASAGCGVAGTPPSTPTRTPLR